MPLKAKKTDSNSTYSGVTITTSFVSLTNTQFATLWKDAQFNHDLDSGLVIVSDDVREYQGDEAWEAVEDFLEQRDASGRKINRGAATVDGWHYQPHWVEWQTAKIGSLYNKKINLSTFAEESLGFSTIKFYNAGGTEVTDPADEGTIVTTVVDFMPTHDYEIFGAKIFQNQKSASDLRLWVVAAPDIPAIYGGQIVFGQGGINLKLLGDGNGADTDGKTSKLVSYNSGIGSNKFRFICKHNAGLQHQMSIMLEFFKAP
jgi:hypothetical protein